jgi:hypothetical protein
MYWLDFEGARGVGHIGSLDARAGLLPGLAMTSSEMSPSREVRVCVYLVIMGARGHGRPQSRSSHRTLADLSRRR